jgi:hypothetical protein
MHPRARGARFYVLERLGEYLIDEVPFLLLIL